MERIKPYEGSEKYIFVSYCHKDSEAVSLLLRRLKDAGYRFWYDEGIDPGSDWPEVIAEHLDRCDSCIAVITPNALDSHNCRREINFALRRKKPLISVFIEPVELSLGMEMQLFASQVIFKYEFSESEFMEKLRSADCLKESLAADRYDRNATEGENSTDLFAVTGAGVKDFHPALERAVKKTGRWLYVALAVCLFFALAAAVLAIVLRNSSASAEPDGNAQTERVLKNGPEGTPDPESTPCPESAAPSDADPDATIAADPTREIDPAETPAATDVIIGFRRKLLVPDVCGMTTLQAQEAILAAGFVPEEGEPYYLADVRFGKVSRQEPPAYSDAYEGETIYYSLCLIDFSQPPAEMIDSINEFDGHYYCIVHEQYSWSAAQYYCAQMGGHLATVNSEQEQFFLESINYNRDRLWLGGFRGDNDPDSWRWVTGEPWEYTCWDKEEPNGFTGIGDGENRVALWPFKWNDLINDSWEQEGFICEWESEPAFLQ